MRTWQEKHEARVLAFRKCPTCTYDLATGEGERNCNYGECPGMPEELDVLCPYCNFNFFTREGAPGCGEFPTCEFAINEAPARVEMLRRWMATT